MTKPQTFIFFGRSGSGKGTQARLLVKKLTETNSHKVLFFETGKKFREFMESDSHTAKITKEIINSGGLLPEFLPIWVWTDFFVKNLTGNEHLVLDGVSRDKDEADILDNALKFYKREKPFIININMSRERATELMKGRGRADDEDEDIAKRHDWYDSDVVPSIEYFRTNPDYIFLDIDGEKAIEEVQAEISNKIASAQVE
ncbi:adenylate kinase family protein [Patescibacteria group bacterium]